jgi:hypothetical protein
VAPEEARDEAADDLVSRLDAALHHPGAVASLPTTAGPAAAAVPTPAANVSTQGRRPGSRG